MKELINYQCIDFKKLLIIKSKELKINDDLCHLLLIIMIMEELGIKPVNPQTITKFSSQSIKKIDQDLLTLLDQKLIDRKYGKLTLQPLYTLLLTNKVTEVKKNNLIELFEEAFRRPLNQMEIQIIQSFKTSGYDDEMIENALNEAVKANVLNFRYIEKILENWAKNGVKRRFAKTEEKHDEYSDEVKNYNWWE